MDVVERVRPLCRRGGETVIEIVDPYFSIWFKFVKPNMHRPELGYVGEVLKEIKKNLDIYVSKTIETITRRDLVYKLLNFIGLSMGKLENGDAKARK